MEQQQPFILTTEQLAQAFETTPNTLLKNFRRHKEDFIEGKDYLIDGDNLSPIEKDNLSPIEKDNLSTKESAKNGTRRKYFWTQTGAFLFTCFLNTSQAKKAFEKLIELAEKPQTTGVSPEEHTALQEKYEVISQFAFKQTEAKHLDDSGLDSEQCGDIDRILARFEKLYEQGKQDSTTKALLKELKEVRKLLAHTQEQFEEADKQFIAQAALKEVVFSDDLLALTQPRILPQIEAPKTVD